MRLGVILIKLLNCSLVSAALSFIGHRSDLWCRPKFLISYLLLLNSYTAHCTQRSDLWYRPKFLISYLLLLTSTIIRRNQRSDLRCRPQNIISSFLTPHSSLLLLTYCLLLPKAYAQQFSKLSTNINSATEELAPVFSFGGDTLFFVRNHHPDNFGNQDIWYSVRQADGLWGKAKNIGTPLNNESENAVNGISADGKTLFLSNIYRGKKMIPGLSTSTFDTKRGWEMPRKVPIQGLNLTDGFIGFSFPVASDSVVLISMAADESEDLFFSFKNRYDEWSDPISLGDVINTDSSEFAPFMAADGVTLYFASSGHGGFGDVDIFRSKRLDASWQRWSKPENLGKNVNSAEFEAYFVVNPKDSSAYFVRAEGEQSADLWQIKLENIADTLQNIKIPLAGPRSDLSNKAESDLQNRLQNKSELDLPRKPILDYLAGTVLFEYKSAQLSDSAQYIVNQLLANLPKASNIFFTLTGFADAIGEASPNLTLSEQRALSIKNYLVTQGILPEQITVQAQGETYSTTDSPETIRRKERRVEIAVKAFR